MNVVREIRSRIDTAYNLSQSFKQKIVRFLTYGAILIVLMVYLWAGSFGLWTHLPTLTTYYDKLATAFTHGSLSLEEKPDPALLALENPYNPEARIGIDVPTDFSLYGGKYYLYFGAVPALLLTTLKLFGFGMIGDQYPVLIFLSGICIVQALMLIKIWDDYFNHLPVWMVPLSVLFCGLASPYLWILTRARFYEAASTGGQFFFLLGFYFVLTAYTNESVSRTRMLIAGTSWALALGSKPTQIFPIGYTCIMLITLMIRTYWQSKSIQKAISPILWVGVPFVIGISILGWYNWARFGSISETGFYYQLAGPYLQKYIHELFSPTYILPNLYNYLLMKPQLMESFPFMESIEGTGASKFSFISLPPIYYTFGGLTGILYSTPFILFLVLIALPGKRITGNNLHGSNISLNWIIAVLLGSFFFEFAPIIAFFWVETRYVADFSQPLFLLTSIGFWQGYGYLINKPVRRNLYAISGLGLIAISIIVGSLLALHVHRGGFREFNPVLWRALYKDLNPYWLEYAIKLLFKVY